MSTIDPPDFDRRDRFADARVPTVRSVKLRRWMNNALGFYLPATIIALVMAFPLFWMLSLALKTNSQIFSYPPRLLETPLRWEHFVEIWSDPRMNIGIQTWNTLVYATVRTFMQVLLSAMAAFVLARYHFRGRNMIFYLVLATVMIPHEVMLVPLYLMVKAVPLAGGNDIWGTGGSGWLDTKAGLILPGILSGYSIFFLRQFFLTIPREVEEAARIDGCSEFAIFWRIAIPMSLPALTALGIFSFQFAWSDYTWPLVISTSEESRTLQLGLAMFSSHDGTDWAMLLTGAAISTLPLIALFVLLQRFIVTGINFGVGK
ncbi:putative binding protein dependent transport protein [Oceanicola granulosus HTCC2516]|uniref:Putative binding protein dependent transport protein n=1 Tax=Oceanicola granulosus (strain ATCC BAA-861 / DSM 15982 / KCTC 12143 / HTCC2516) TaxID=314256 RepID=Q2CHC6_OCEGH|nr:carbohydrate ABC transporter permease [Oceanicola granulosus]EAR52113.1 putative binding protein dependent transport protein [Oceanicola granulosus HTCC2516]